MGKESFDVGHGYGDFLTRQKTMRPHDDMRDPIIGGVHEQGLDKADGPVGRFHPRVPAERDFPLRYPLGDDYGREVGQVV